MSLRRFASALSTEFSRLSTPCWLPEQRYENFKYFIPLNGNWTHNCRVCSRTLKLLRYNGLIFYTFFIFFFPFYDIHFKNVKSIILLKLNSFHSMTQYPNSWTWYPCQHIQDNVKVLLRHFSFIYSLKIYWIYIFFYIF